MGSKVSVSSDPDCGITVGDWPVGDDTKSPWAGSYFITVMLGLGVVGGVMRRMSL